MLLAFLFFHFSSSACEFNISTPGISIRTYNLTSATDLCINLTELPSLVAFRTAPASSTLLSYRQKVLGSPPDLDFSTPFSDLPFALRPYSAGSLTVRALPGSYSLALIGVGDCTGGVVALTTNSRSINFDPWNPPPRSLALASRTCVLLLNAALSNVTATMQLHDRDVFTVGNMTYVTSENGTWDNSPGDALLVMIDVSRVPGDRWVHLAFAAKGGGEQERLVDFGGVAQGIVTPAPTAGTETNVDMRVSRDVLIALVVVGAAAAVAVVVACVRYMIWRREGSDQEKPDLSRSGRRGYVGS